jgi:hypothetical protein
MFLKTYKRVVYMPNEQMLSVTSLHTVSGASLAVFLIVQIIKNLPLLRWVPTKWLAVSVGELVLLAVSSYPMTTAEWIVVFVNGLQASSAAIGGYQILVGCHSDREVQRVNIEIDTTTKETIIHRKSGGV